MPKARTMIVTGASSGIGRALAFEAARDGFAIVAVARRTELLAEIALHIRANGGACTVVPTDVRASDAPGRIVDAALQAFGGIDVVVNNAGGGAFGDLLEQSDAALEAQWQLHVAAPLRIARAALPHLEKVRGQLIFLGSGIARVPVPQYGGYAIAKAAIRAAAIQLRRELGERGVTVTYVDPGLVATEFHDAAGVERDTRVKAATPERVARAILRGVKRRRPTVNAVWWQSAGTAIGEMAGTLADRTVSSFTPTPKPAAPLPCHPERVEGRPPESNSLEKALEPVARRMERVKLPPTFVREALVPGATLELNELAMRWAGMPNKNERAAMHEVLEALAASGYLEPMGDETWKVVRAAD
ncbi:MAG TPA: SDR family NAD(P)-dependent oxidoreductase [Candidatus Baltobacteraceae bacterium]|nr:SDR family NAD(P)-dependent oxidoreductase [Candidatus Baltobacteraceae bacterium]